MNAAEIAASLTKAQHASKRRIKADIAAAAKQLQAARIILKGQTDDKPWRR